MECYFFKCSIFCFFYIVNLSCKYMRLSSEAKRRLVLEISWRFAYENSSGSLERHAQNCKKKTHSLQIYCFWQFWKNVDIFVRVEAFFFFQNGSKMSCKAEHSLSLINFRYFCFCVHVFSLSTLSYNFLKMDCELCKTNLFKCIFIFFGVIRTLILSSIRVNNMICYLWACMSFQPINTVK